MNPEAIFAPNRLLSLGILGRDEKGETIIHYHSSRLENIVKDNLWIAAPQEQGELVPVSPGETIEVFLISKNEIYVFNSEVKDRVKRGNMAFLIIGMPASVVRMQRRDYVRLDVSLPVSLKKGLLTWKGMTKNLSGGGMLVVFTEKGSYPEKGDEVFFCLEFNEEKLMGKGVTLREDDTNLRAFRFTEIMEGDREKVIKFIFRRQIELKRKGLLQR
ncbi:MAG TPA: flagellar brake domain-containing protein [Atribacteraceae bacterium]|nr:flagellar brake domain-containing protein [Atribacteraceae bacterium]